ncbi:MAG: bifunctional nicotinamide-nucleotide adenylyltransferase/Nudix hydroxylase [Burkholderiaceae bacterium]
MQSSVQRKFPYAVLIGRFQPFHFGHQRLLQQALRLAQRVLVLVGSDKQRRSVKNPFNLEERQRMIRGCLQGQEQARVSVVGVQDAPYNDALWIAGVHSAVERLIAADGGNSGAANVAIVGHLKDDSSYYLKLFPKWQFVGLESAESMNATDIRRLYFDPENRGQLSADVMPDSTAAFLETFARSPHYQALCDERAFLADYQHRYRYAGSDFSPIFCTVDAVVVEAGYILLVQRKFSPGQGTWALPGGFLGQRERLLDGAIRELREETRLKVPVPVLRGSVRGQQVFDAPDRSERGRTVTYAFHFELAHNQWTGLSEVRAADDAQAVRWVAVNEFLGMQEQLYEDHFFIANHFLGGLGQQT